MLTKEELEAIIARELPDVDEDDIWVNVEKPRNKNYFYDLPDDCWYVTYPKKSIDGHTSKECLSIDKETGEIKAHFNLNDTEIKY